MPLDKNAKLKISCCCCFSTKTYIVCTQKNRLYEKVPLRTQNKCWNWWIIKYSQFESTKNLPYEKSSHVWKRTHWYGSIFIIFWLVMSLKMLYKTSWNMRVKRLYREKWFSFKGKQIKMINSIDQGTNYLFESPNVKTALLAMTVTTSHASLPVFNAIIVLVGYLLWKWCPTPTPSFNPSQKQNKMVCF